METKGEEFKMDDREVLFQEYNNLWNEKLVHKQSIRKFHNYLSYITAIGSLALAFYGISASDFFKVGVDPALTNHILKNAGSIVRLFFIAFTPVDIPRLAEASIDVRALGLCLSVVGVTALLRAVDTTEPVFVARHTLTTGQAVTHDDLAVAHVRIVGAGRPYLPASRSLAGLVVVRAVPAGELVPSAALGRADEVDLRPVTVPVEPAVAKTLPRGAVVDVWVAARAVDRADAYERPRLVAAGVQVADRSVARSGWGGSAAI